MKKKKHDKKRFLFPDGKKNSKERTKGMNEETENRVPEEQAAEPVTAEETTAAEAEKEEACEDVDPVETLKKELEKQKAQADEYLDLAQRQKAEFANYRRRTEGVRKEAYDDGRRDTLSQMLSVLDNLERALDAAAEDSPMREGVDMVLRQMKDILTKMGVETIDPLGQPFDAQTMNAVMQGTSEEGEPGTVCMVLQKGYQLAGHVIRHAMVKVVAG